MDIQEENFSLRIRNFRLGKLWTLKQLSEKTGLPVSTLSQIENGKVKPHALTIAKIRNRLPELFDKNPQEEIA